MRAQRLGAENVGSEHVLLGVLAAEAGTGVLAGLGVRDDGVENFLAQEDAWWNRSDSRCRTP